ncbi:MAG TPA: hypothetical protein PJ986_11360 [Gammaproteobacteria bacterium]|nr:hypothetical protein [Gammaproteobacteria bacterium]
MYTITGAFNRSADAELAIEALHDAGFALDNGPPSASAATDGGTAALPTPDPAFDVSAEPAASAGAEHAPHTAVKGIAVGGTLGFIVGLGALPVLGPAAPFAGAGVGAYGGSLLGALKGMKGADESAARRDDENARAGDVEDPAAADRARIERGEGGVITVAAHGEDGREKATEILWSCGAVSVTQGEAGDSPVPPG